MKIRNRQAFTLVETMIVVLISTVVFAGIYSTFIVGNKAWAHYSDSVIVKKEARGALIGMVNELREAQKVRVIQGPNGSAVHFYRPAVGAVSYVWSKKGDDANRIIRYNRLNVRILAQYISALSFQYTKDAIVINIAASKLTTPENRTLFSLREKVALRSETALFTQ